MCIYILRSRIILSRKGPMPYPPGEAGDKDCLALCTRKVRTHWHLSFRLMEAPLIWQVERNIAVTQSVKAARSERKPRTTSPPSAGIPDRKGVLWPTLKPRPIGLRLLQSPSPRWRCGKAEVPFNWVWTTLVLTSETWCHWEPNVTPPKLQLWKSMIMGVTSYRENWEVEGFKTRTFNLGAIDLN
jgi:hypothetical protein